MTQAKQFLTFLDGNRNAIDRLPETAMKLIAAATCLLLVSMQPLVASSSSTAPATKAAPVVLTLGGPQKDDGLVRWRSRGGDDAVVNLAKEAHVTVRFPSGREFALQASNVFADSSAGIVWHVEMRPDWPLTGQRELAGRVRRQLEEWKIPPDDKQNSFLAEMERAGDELPDGWNTIQHFLLELNEQTSIGLRLDGSKGTPDKSKGGWFVVFEFALEQRLAGKKG